MQGSNGVQNGVEMTCKQFMDHAGRLSGFYEDVGLSESSKYFFYCSCYILTGHFARIKDCTFLDSSALKDIHQFCPIQMFQLLSGGYFGLMYTTPQPCIGRFSVLKLSVEN